jgi:hypothetical protein
MRSLPLTLVPLLSATACAFLLDFDELQQGEPPASEDAGAEAGECGACETTDPCEPKRCVDGKCVSEKIVGLGDDGLDVSYPVEQAYRVTLVALGDSFYASAFMRRDGAERLGFLKIGFDVRARDASELPSRLSSELGLPVLETAVPISAAGFDTGPLRVIAAFAVEGGEVYRVQLDGELAARGVEALTLPAARYGTGDRFLHPIPWHVGPQAFVGWVTDTGIVHVWKEGSSPALFGAGGVVGFAPMATQAGAAVLWLGNGVSVQHELQPLATAITECEALASFTFRSVAASSSDKPFVLNYAFWSKSRAELWASQGVLIVCSDSLCQAPLPLDCAGEDGSLFPGMRGLDYVLFSIPGRPSALVYDFSVAQIDDGSQSRLLYAVGQTDWSVSGEPKSTVLGGPTDLTRPEPSAQAATGPAVAFSGTDRLLVGWVEPKAVRLRRFKLCLPPAAGQ